MPKSDVLSSICTINSVELNLFGGAQAVVVRQEAFETDAKMLCVELNRQEICLDSTIVTTQADVARCQVAGSALQEQLKICRY